MRSLSAKQGVADKGFFFKLLRSYERIFNFFADGIITINRIDNETISKMFKKKSVVTIGNYLDILEYQERINKVGGEEPESERKSI